jgi:pyrroloquinoline quinone (PQQ) biosynthesis protein C
MSVAVAPESELAALEREIAAHPAVRHPFLGRFGSEKLTLEQIRAFGLQHYQLVKIFTTYMTHLFARLPESSAALRAVFDDELGQHTVFRSHVHLYRNFLKAAGCSDEDWGRAAWLEETRAFIENHLCLTRDGDILLALGAIGPGHEFSIPLMFESLLKGLRRDTGLTANDLEYFSMHIVEDPGHAQSFNRLIASVARTAPEWARIREGALWSLELRAKFWEGCSRIVFGASFL